MNKKVIMISKCVKEIVSDRIHSQTYEFHFKGVFNGELLAKVHLDYIRPLGVGTEYLMYIEVTDIKDGVLLGTIEKIKPLDECITKD